LVKGGVQQNLTHGSEWKGEREGTAIITVSSWWGGGKDEKKQHREKGNNFPVKTPD